MPRTEQLGLTREDIFVQRTKMFPRLPKILTEGDSWFDLPFPGRNIIDQLITHYSGEACWLRLEHSGDEATEMFLRDPKQHVNQVDTLQRVLKTYAFDLILISAGGNDIIGTDGDFFGSLLQSGDEDEPASFLDLDRLTDKLDEIEEAYRALFALRDQYQLGKKIVAHSYDDAIPQDRGVRLVFPIKGPWFWPHLIDAGITSPRVQCDIVHELMERFKARLQTLADEPGNKFLLLDTSDTVNDDQWEDELHPSAEGFHTVAEKFLPALREFCPGHFQHAWPLRAD
ncbi:MAG: SGNH/GDSL hydrolase family protein [Verrucomicrobia bacterium]|nr:SGNH/GDSL hydrolase family protein [Verrucomicrobiota bacterium]